MAKKASARSKANNTAAAEMEDPLEAPPEPPEDAAPNGYGELDKVRNILFGAQSREIEQRFVRLEEHVAQEVDTLREALAARFDALEAHLNHTGESLDERIAQEQAQRAEAAQHLDVEIQAVARSLQQHREQLDAHIVETERALRTSLAEQASAASRDAEARFEALSKQLEQAVAELRRAKTDCVGLADLLAQVSEQLRNEA